MNPLWLIRMARWVRHPPSPRMVAVWVVVIAICVAIASAEWMWGWPDWLTVNGKMRLPKP